MTSLPHYLLPKEYYDASYLKTLFLEPFPLWVGGNGVEISFGFDGTKIQPTHKHFSISKQAEKQLYQLRSHSSISSPLPIDLLPCPPSSPLWVYYMKVATQTIGLPTKHFSQEAKTLWRMGRFSPYLLCLGHWVVGIFALLYGQGEISSIAGYAYSPKKELPPCILNITHSKAWDAQHEMIQEAFYTTLERVEPYFSKSDVPIYLFKDWLNLIKMPKAGVEPTTYALRVRRSTN